MVLMLFHPSHVFRIIHLFLFSTHARTHARTHAHTHTHTHTHAHSLSLWRQAVEKEADNAEVTAVQHQLLRRELQGRVRRHQFGARGPHCVMKHKPQTHTHTHTHFCVVPHYPVFS